MRFQLNFKSGKPVYLQLVDQVKAAAASGAVQAGEPLPSIRPLAEELRVNRNTVAKAYAELESQGVIETIAGKGCFVRASQLAVQEGRPPQARSPRRSTTPSCRRTTCRSRRADSSGSPKTVRRVRAAARRAPRRHDSHDTPTHPSSRSTTWCAATAAPTPSTASTCASQPGRCYGFFGRNGAGKTTTIKCLLNLLRPTSGEVQRLRPGSGARTKSPSSRGSPTCPTTSRSIRG